MRRYGVAVIVCVKVRAHNADVGVPVALAPSTDYNMGDPIVVRPQHLGNLGVCSWPGKNIQITF